MLEAELFENLLNTAMDNVDVKLVALLIACGFIIKHFRPLEKIQNELIPVILLVISFIWSYFETGLAAVTILTAVFSAAVAIGIHQQGRNYTFDTIVPALREVFAKVLHSIFGGLATEDPEVEEPIEEVVEPEMGEEPEVEEPIEEMVVPEVDEIIEEEVVPEETINEME
jgi:hypothetical protein